MRRATQSLRTVRHGTHALPQVAAMGRYYQITAPPDAFPGTMFPALF